MKGAKNPANAALLAGIFAMEANRVTVSPLQSQRRRVIRFARAISLVSNPPGWDGSCAR
jgi:hypothetical protein